MREIKDDLAWFDLFYRKDSERLCPPKGHDMVQCKIYQSVKKQKTKDKQIDREREKEREWERERERGIKRERERERERKR